MWKRHSAAPILTLANLPGESKDPDAYCAVVSAVDLLGNESDPLDPDDDTCMTVRPTYGNQQCHGSGTTILDTTGDVDESMQDATCIGQQCWLVWISRRR